MGQLQGAAICFRHNAFTGRLNASLRQKRAMASAALPFVLHWAVDWGELAAAARPSPQPLPLCIVMEAVGVAIDAKKFCDEAKAVCRAVAHPAIITGNHARDFRENVINTRILTEERRRVEIVEEYRRLVELGVYPRR